MSLDLPIFINYSVSFPGMRKNYFVMWVIRVTSKHWELSFLQDEWASANTIYCLRNDVEILGFIDECILKLSEGPQSRLLEFVCV